jgi:hypothetical protein
VKHLHRIRPALFIIALLATPAFAQAPQYQPMPRAADGHPDLSGFWASPWTTTLERPPGVTSLVLKPADTEAAGRSAQDKIGSNDPLEGLGRDEARILRVRGEMRSGLIVSTADGMLPLTETGRRLKAERRAGAQLATDGPEDRPQSERCLTSAASRPPWLLAPTDNARQIVQTPKMVVLFTEIMSEARLVPVGAPPRSTGPWNGVTAARWEGDTLVIETSGLERGYLHAVPGSAFWSSASAKIVERFEPVHADEIVYSFTVEDPGIYTQPWRAEYALIRTNETPFEFACHEGNYGLANILSGARAAERRTGK